MNNEFWKVTPMGHEPLFPINCPRCGTPKKLRYSQIFVPYDVREALKSSRCMSNMSFEDRYEILNKHGYAEDRAYKCPKCQHWEIFGIPLSKEDLKIIQMSDRKSMYIPLDEWEDTHPILEKLKTLGYW